MRAAGNLSRSSIVVAAAMLSRVRPSSCARALLISPPPPRERERAQLYVGAAAAHLRNSRRSQLAAIYVTQARKLYYPAREECVSAATRFRERDMRELYYIRTQ